MDILSLPFSIPSAEEDTRPSSSSAGASAEEYYLVLIAALKPVEQGRNPKGVIIFNKYQFPSNLPSIPFSSLLLPLPVSATPFQLNRTNRSLVLTGHTVAVEVSSESDQKRSQTKHEQSINKLD